MAAFPEPTVSTRQGRLFQVSEKPIARPFLKWAGGKTRLLRVLRRYIPKAYGTYFEPFLGGGAFFFDTAPDRTILGDSNAELVSCYEVVDCNRVTVLESRLSCR